jgi:hypothetical protein
MPSRRKGTSDRMRVRYQLGYDKSSPSICPTAFCNAFGITAYLRKRLKKEVKDGLFHMESNKQQFYENEPVGKDDLKEIKSLLKQCKKKLPKTLQENKERKRYSIRSLAWRPLLSRVSDPHSPFCGMAW